MIMFAILVQIAIICKQTAATVINLFVGFIH